MNEAVKARRLLLAEREVEKLRQDLSAGWLTLIDNEKEKRRSERWNGTPDFGGILNNE